MRGALLRLVHRAYGPRAGRKRRARAERPRRRLGQCSCAAPRGARSHGGPHGGPHGASHGALSRCGARPLTVPPARGACGQSRGISR
eukprot:3663896-Prymnesium_polylepis.1